MTGAEILENRLRETFSQVADRTETFDVAANTGRSSGAARRPGGRRAFAVAAFGVVLLAVLVAAVNLWAAPSSSRVPQPAATAPPTRPASPTSRPGHVSAEGAVTEPRLRSVFDAALQCMSQAGLVVREPQITIVPGDVQVRLTLDYQASGMNIDQASTIDAGCRSELIGLSDVWHAGGRGRPNAWLREFLPVVDATGKIVTRNGYVVLISPGSPAVNPSPVPPDVTLPNGKVSKGAATVRAADQVDAALRSGHGVLVPVSDPSLDKFCIPKALATHSCDIGSSRADKPQPGAVP